MIQDKYIDLPDGMEPVNVQKNLDELFSEIEKNAALPVLDIAEAFYQLADRQWHTYSVLPTEYKKRLEKWILDHWLSDSLEFVKEVAFIAGSVGLPSVLDRFELESHNLHLPENVRKQIARTVEELKPRIHDPYSGMPKAT